MEVEIRKAITTDARAISDLLRRLKLFKQTFGESERDTFDRVSRQLELCCCDDSHAVFVAYDQVEVLLGYCAVHWLPYLIFSGPEGFVSELFVDDSARGQGVGTALLQTVESEAVQRGCCRLMLLNIRERESYQRGFYQKCGWEERTDAANFIYRLPNLTK